MLEVKMKIIPFFAVLLFSFTSVVSGELHKNVKSGPKITDIALKGAKTVLIVSSTLVACKLFNDMAITKEDFAIGSFLTAPGVLGSYRETKELYSMVKTYLKKE